MNWLDNSVTKFTPSRIVLLQLFTTVVWNGFSFRIFVEFLLIILKLYELPGNSEDILWSLPLILYSFFSASTQDSDLDVCPLTVLGVLKYLHWIIYVWGIVKSWTFCQEHHYLQNWFSDEYCRVSLVLCTWEWQLSWDVIVDTGSLFNYVVMLRDMIKGICTWICSSVYLKTQHLELENYIAQWMLITWVTYMESEWYGTLDTWVTQSVKHKLISW